MPAHTRTRSHGPAPGVAGSELPWWALALPVLAFAVLLTLIAGSGDAHAAQGAGPAVGDALERIRQTLGR